MEPLQALAAIKRYYSPCNVALVLGSDGAEVQAAIGGIVPFAFGETIGKGKTMAEAIEDARQKVIAEQAAKLAKAEEIADRESARLGMLTGERA